MLASTEDLRGRDGGARLEPRGPAPPPTQPVPGDTPPSTATPGPESRGSTCRRPVSSISRSPVVPQTAGPAPARQSESVAVRPTPRSRLRAQNGQPIVHTRVAAVAAATV